MSKEVNVLSLVKGDERYVFIWSCSEDYTTQVLRTLGRYASNPELNCTWYDAAVLSHKIRAGLTDQSRFTFETEGEK